MSTSEKSSAHLLDMNVYGRGKWPDGLVPWEEAKAPDLQLDSRRGDTGRLRACGYCGSMHPADLAQAIREGAVGSWADRKYGWPHKAYFDKIPNPHAGMLEVRTSTSHPGPGFPREVREPRFDERTGARVDDYVTYTEEPKPAQETTYGKFYSVHLIDASPEDCEVIEKHLGLHFTFSPDGKVAWSP